MITRLFADQYKCLVDFELQLGPLQLLTGRNGSGKTTVFDVLESLQRVISGQSLPSIEFPAGDTLTAWSDRPEQRFELTVEGNGGLYEYSLLLRHDLLKLECRVGGEELKYNGRLLLRHDGNDVELFADDGVSLQRYPVRGLASPLSEVRADERLSQIVWFRNRAGAGVHVYSPDPKRIGTSTQENHHLKRDLSNLVAWLRFSFFDQPETYNELYFVLIDEVIGGLGRIENIAAPPGGPPLQFCFEADSEAGGGQAGYPLTLNQLSDGQRMLVGLYALAILDLKPETTLCIEEPDNYLALSEIQPWLSMLRDYVESRGAQCLLISHHPDVLNYLAADSGIWLERDDSGIVRAERFAHEGDEPLTPAELVGRGWR